MKTTIDNAGRIVLPKSVLESASLCAGAEIEITMRGDDVIELRPAPAPCVSSDMDICMWPLR